MPLRLTEIDWREDHIQHVARHHVDPQEVEEACFSSACHIETGRGGGGVYYVTGQTATGRYLMIVIRYLGRGRANVITAREMDNHEKARFKKRT